MIVVGAWILAIVFSAMPFVFSHQLNVTQAIFESVSGWTTTGLSVVNTEQTAHIFLIHRSVTQFFWRGRNRPSVIVGPFKYIWTATLSIRGA